MNSRCFLKMTLQSAPNFKVSAAIFWQSSTGEHSSGNFVHERTSPTVGGTGIRTTQNQLQLWSARQFSKSRWNPFLKTGCLKVKMVIWKCGHQGGLDPHPHPTRGPKKGANSGVNCSNNWKIWKRKISNYSKIIKSYVTCAVFWTMIGKEPESWPKSGKSLGSTLPKSWDKR